jgi:hypothetical protein
MYAKDEIGSAIQLRAQEIIGEMHKTPWPVQRYGA